MSNRPAPLYMDHQATTPVAKDVLEAMLPWFTERFGNPASRSHRYGWDAEEAIALARKSVAELIGAQAKEIVFLSGATEANNLALVGLARRRQSDARHAAARGQDPHPLGHIISVATEHKSVLDPLHSLAAEGFALTLLEPASDGLVSLAALEEALREDTFLVSVMHANNEIGVVQPLAEIGALCRSRGVLFHTDATQGAAWLAIDVEEMAIDLLSLSAHKMAGPKGVGALYVRRKPRVPLSPTVHGGGHERGLRSGSLNVPGIVGLGAAARRVAEHRDAAGAHVAALRDRLLHRLQEGLPDLVVHGSVDRRLPGNLSIAIPGVDAEQLLLATRDVVALSTGSACTSATLEPSHVLRAIGVPHDLAHATVRFGLAAAHSFDDVDQVADAVVHQARHLRAIR